MILSRTSDDFSSWPWRNKSHGWIFYQATCSLVSVLYPFFNCGWANACALACAWACSCLPGRIELQCLVLYGTSSTVQKEQETKWERERERERRKRNRIWHRKSGWFVSFTLWCCTSHWLLQWLLLLLLSLLLLLLLLLSLLLVLLLLLRVPKLEFKRYIGLETWVQQLPNVSLKE